MTTNKIDLMHELFGYSAPDEKCKTCSNLYKYTHSRSYYKCDVYGYSASAASDWRVNQQGCGMYNKDCSGMAKVKDYAKHRPKKQEEEQIEGQMEFEWK